MLEQGQAAFAAALREGPARLPPDLFAGEWAAVLRGMKVHANSISHARLVALEATFPRTRAYLGDAEFNRLSRDFIECGGARGRSVSRIGETFPRFLAGDCAKRVVDSAKVEWQWLESFHAAEADSLTLAGLAGLDEAALLATRVAPHPAAAVVMIDHGTAPIIDAALSVPCPALLITRPDAEVRIAAATDVDAEALTLAATCPPLGNIFALFVEHHGDGVRALLAFLAAGSLKRAEA